MSSGPEDREIIVSQASGTDAKESPSNPFARFKSDPPPSYSELLTQISAGKVKDLQLVPARREVIVEYDDGRNATVSTLANDQQILRTAESAGVPLTVKDVRQEQALAGLAGNLALIALIVIGLSFLLRRSSQAAAPSTCIAWMQAAQLMCPSVCVVRGQCETLPPSDSQAQVGLGVQCAGQHRCGGYGGARHSCGGIDTRRPIASGPTRPPVRCTASRVRRHPLLLGSWDVPHIPEGSAGVV